MNGARWEGQIPDMASRPAICQLTAVDPRDGRSPIPFAPRDLRASREGVKYLILRTRNKALTEFLTASPRGHRKLQNIPLFTQVSQCRNQSMRSKIRAAGQGTAFAEPSEQYPRAIDDPMANLGLDADDAPNEPMPAAAAVREEAESDGDDAKVDQRNKADRSAAIERRSGRKRQRQMMTAAKSALPEALEVEVVVPHTDAAWRVRVLVDKLSSAPAVELTEENLDVLRLATQEFMACNSKLGRGRSKSSKPKRSAVATGPWARRRRGTRAETRDRSREPRAGEEADQLAAAAAAAASPSSPSSSSPSSPGRVVAAALPSFVGS